MFIIFYLYFSTLKSPRKICLSLLKGRLIASFQRHAARIRAPFHLRCGFHPGFVAKRTPGQPSVMVIQTYTVLNTILYMANGWVVHGYNMANGWYLIVVHNEVKLAKIHVIKPLSAGFEWMPEKPFWHSSPISCITCLTNMNTTYLANVLPYGH